MNNLKGLFIEDELANIKIYTRLFEIQGLELTFLNELPQKVSEFYDVILKNNIDFLVIDYHLDKLVDYTGLDVLREIRKNDSTIYAVLLTNRHLEEFQNEFGDYDYELTKDSIVSRHIDVTEKIKRACERRRENEIIASMDNAQIEDSNTIKLLKEINSKLDSLE